MPVSLTARAESDVRDITYEHGAAQDTNNLGFVMIVEYDVTPEKKIQDGAFCSDLNLFTVFRMKTIENIHHRMYAAG